MEILKDIDNYLQLNKDPLPLCIKNHQYNLGLILGNFVQKNDDYYHNMHLLKNKTNNLLVNTNLIVEQPQVVTEVQPPIVTEVVKRNSVKLLCNWCNSSQLMDLWKKMSKNNGWDNFYMTLNREADFYIIINSPQPNDFYEEEKTLVFRMEPNMKNDEKQWGKWADPKGKFLKVFKHENGDYNNCEWHLSKDYKYLSTTNSIKNSEYDNVISTVLSQKYNDPGHVLRVDFVKFLEKKDFPVHVYGSNFWNYKNYKGELPYHKKDDAIFPYKYTFNAENQSIAHYFTEKLIDGILGECLVFYHGCYNVKEYIDERAFVYLDLEKPEESYEKIMKAIDEDWYAERLPYIRQAKKKILDELQFFPRVSKFISESK